MSRPLTQLTDKQVAFLDALFGDANGDPRKAADLVGYSHNVVSTVVKSLKDEIIERAQFQLAMYAPKAVAGLVKGLDHDGSDLGANIKLTTAKEILDRVGISKREQIEVRGDAQIGLFILPAKKTENE